MRPFLILCLCAQVVFSQNIILREVNVIPITTNTVLTAYDVYIKAGKIEKISPATSFPFPKNYTVIDCKGKYLIPGLADMHAHFPDDKSPIQLQDYLRLNLAAGVTTIRSMRGEASQLPLRDSIRSGKKIAPNIYVSYVLDGNDSLWTKDSIEKIIALAKSQKYDFIKYLNGISAANMNYIAESCKKNSIHIAGHAYDRNLMKSAGLGFASIEHYQPVLGMYMKDSANFSKNIMLLKEKQTAICPTLSFYHVYSYKFSEEELQKRNGMAFVSKKASDTWLKDYTEALNTAKEQLKTELDAKYKDVFKKQFSDFNKVFKRLADEGVLILLSPDDGLFNVPGFAMAEEMKLYQQAGLSNYQILQSATLNAAIYFKDTKNWGSVEVGKRADLVLLNANPLENIENITKVEATLLNGKYYSQKELLK